MPSIALVSTVVFFGVIVVVIVNSPGLAAVKQAFFDGEQFEESLPEHREAFVVNIRLFLIAEVFILVFALFLAVMRSLPGPVFFPIRRAGGRLHRPVPRHPDASS